MSAVGVTPTTVIETGPLTADELLELYSIARSQNAQISDVVRVLEAIIGRDTAEDLTIAEINETLTALAASIRLNALEIEDLNRIIALLLFELMEQGIKIQSTDLLIKLKLYLYGNRR